MKKLLIFLLLMSSLFAWERTWTFGEYHNIKDIIQLPDSTYIFAGRSQRSFYSPEFTVVRFDTEGDTLWIRFFGGDDNNSARALVQIDDSSFVVTGDYDGLVMTLICLDFDGETRWMRLDTLLISMEVEGYGLSLDLDLDSNIVSNFDYAYTTFTRTGDLVWSRSFDYDYPDMAGFMDMNVVRCEPYGYVDCGYYYTGTLSFRKAMIVYYDLEGDTLWVRNFGDADHNSFDAVVVIDNPAPGQPRGFIAVGSTKNYLDSIPNSPAFVVRTDMEGNRIWSRNITHPENYPLGGTARAMDIVWAGKEPYQTKFVITGLVRSNIDYDQRHAMLFAISDTLDGDTLWTKICNERYTNVTSCRLTSCHDGGFTMAGHILDSGEWPTQVWFCHVDSNGNQHPYSINEPQQTIIPVTLTINAYPNPFNSAIEISLNSEKSEGEISIFDINGRKVFTMPENHSIWRPEDMPSGVYLVRAVGEDEVAEKVIVFVK